MTFKICFKEPQSSNTRLLTDTGQLSLVSITGLRRMRRRNLRSLMPFCMFFNGFYLQNGLFHNFKYFNYAYKVVMDIAVSFLAVEIYDCE